MPFDKRYRFSFAVRHGLQMPDKPVHYPSKDTVSMLLSELTKRLNLKDDAQTEEILLNCFADPAAFTEVQVRVNRMRACCRRLDASGEVIERTYRNGKDGNGMVAIADEFDLKV